MDNRTVRISPKARAAYRAIEELINDNRPVLPNQADVATKLGVCGERARQLCRELRDAGLVSWTPHAEHTLHITAPLEQREKERAA